MFWFVERVTENIGLSGCLWANFQLTPLKFKLFFDLLAFYTVSFQKNVLCCWGFPVDILDYISQTSQTRLFLITPSLRILIGAGGEEV